MPIASRKKHPTRRPQSGFSMVELLIAVALGIILSWAILDVTLTSSRTAREVELTSETVENGRYLSQLLKNEIAWQGFMDAWKTTAAALSSSLMPAPALQPPIWLMV